MARERTIALTLLDEVAEETIQELMKDGHAVMPDDDQPLQLKPGFRIVSNPTITDPEERAKIFKKSRGLITPERADEWKNNIQGLE